jgi:putative FmdB family regulatory protein
MPIYEFHCAQCERDSEVLVRSAEWRGTKCPHCGSTRLDKKFSTFAAAGGNHDAPVCDSGGGRGGGCCGGHCQGH